jgi:IS66 Orf2 like protein
MICVLGRIPLSTRLLLRVDQFVSTSRQRRVIAGRFKTRCGGLIKVLWHDGQGMCLFAKRLGRSRFLWPSPADGLVTITPAQLGYLLEGTSDCKRAARSATRIIPHHPHRINPVSRARPPRADLRAQFFFICAF